MPCVHGCLPFTASGAGKEARCIQDRTLDLSQSRALYTCTTPGVLQVDDLRETAARLACDNEELLSQLSRLTSAADKETAGGGGGVEDEYPRRGSGHSGTRGRGGEERGKGGRKGVPSASTARVDNERRGAAMGGGFGGADERVPVGIPGDDGVGERWGEEEEEGAWQERTRDGCKDVHEVRRVRDGMERRALVGCGGTGRGSTPGGRCHEEETSSDDGQAADAWRAEEEARRRREKEEDDDGNKRGERGGGIDTQDGGGEGRTLPDAEDEALLVPRGGPIPVPSMLRPHSLGARERGGAGGKSIAAASLLRYSNTRWRACVLYRSP